MTGEHQWDRDVAFTQPLEGAQDRQVVLVMPELSRKKSERIRKAIFRSDRRHIPRALKEVDIHAVTEHQHFIRLETLEVLQKAFPHVFAARLNEGGVCDTLRKIEPPLQEFRARKKFGKLRVLDVVD